LYEGYRIGNDKGFDLTEPPKRDKILYSSQISVGCIQQIAMGENEKRGCIKSEERACEKRICT
jgi:hypothetical protein